MIRIICVFALVAASAALSACVSVADGAGDAPRNAIPDTSLTPARNQPETAGLTLASSEPEEASRGPSGYELQPGSGDFIDRHAARRPARTTTSSGDIVLNFQASELSEVIDTLLGEIMNVNYMVDPAVNGKVTLATSQPIGRDAVLPTLETILRINGAVLTVSDGIYSVVPQAKALARPQKPQLKPGSGKGFQVLVVPLRFVAAGQLVTILNPLLPDGSILSVDAQRNLLTVAGTQMELQQALDTIAIFDVDQMSGMSLGFFPLQAAEAASVRQELVFIFGGIAEGSLGGLIRFVTVDRLNAIVVVTPQSSYLESARDWIERLDHTEDVAGQSMFVYAVQNGRAEHLADLLSGLFLDQAGTNRSSAGDGSGSLSPSPTRTAASGGAPGTTRIVADDENNTLVIMASRAEYPQIRAAIRMLDVIPLQVLVEATIVEVSLTDELSYGLQWFFKNGVGDKNGVGRLSPLTVDPSFSYTVSSGAGNVRAVLALLAADSRLNVISSPSLLVMDNRTATIKVGDQVPVRTSETTSLSTSGSDPLVTSTIQYRDTGVLLEVTPRVNQGGMVSMEITQDVNDVDQTTTSEIDSPTIIQRRITTSVAVQSGETIVLGGLIRENKSVSKSGVPGLRNIPGLGRLFSSEVTSDTRTELLVLITPTAIATLADAREATQELKNKMPAIDFDLKR